MVENEFFNEENFDEYIDLLVKMYFDGRLRVGGRIIDTMITKCISIAFERMLVEGYRVIQSRGVK